MPQEIISRIENPDCPYAGTYELDGMCDGLVCVFPSDRKRRFFKFCHTACRIGGLGCPIDWERDRNYGIVPTRYSIQSNIEKNELQKLPSIIYGVVQEEN